MATLTSLLARDAVVPVQTIEAALQRQVLEGGEIDTALLELGAVAENVLSAYRAASFGHLPASRSEFEHVEPSLLARVPAELAREFQVVPLGVERDALVLASAEPLADAQADLLAKRLCARLSLRIANEPRVQLALSQHYGLELSGRLRVLRDRLREQDPGVLCAVQPSTTTPPVDRTSLACAPRIEKAQVRPLAPSQESAAVRVMQVVSLGADLRPAAKSPLPPIPQLPSPPLTAQPVGAAVSITSKKPAGRLVGSPKGPFTHQQAAKRLAEASDRDRVLDVFFSFARQYFEYTVLFAVRDARLFGLEAWGQSSTLSVRSIEVPLARDGSIQGVLLARKARVVELAAGDADRILVSAIGRTHAQPCALVPVVIRQRVVSLLYGDRGGEPIALTELSDVASILAHVGGAFERIIRAHKAHAMELPTSQLSQLSVPLPPRLPIEASALIAAADLVDSRLLKGSKAPRSSRPPEPAAVATHAVETPSPRTFSQPTAGAGSYALHDRDRSLSTHPIAPKTVRAPYTEAEPAHAPSALSQTAADRLVDQLMRSTPDDGECVKEILALGGAVLPALAARFPGPLWFDRYKARQTMPDGRDVSAIARALYAFDQLAIPYIAELMASSRVEARLCAILLAADRVCADLLWPVYRCAFDPEGQVRLQATSALPLFRRIVGFDQALRALRERARDERESVGSRQAAIEAISALRDPGSVELLASLSSHQTRQLSVPAHRALVAISAQDFGDQKKKWQTWFDKKRAQHRIEWLIESLMHPEERLRSTASIELQKATQVYYGFSANASKRDREQAQKRYRDWWQAEGRRAFR